jgi:hypothetical protein
MKIQFKYLHQVSRKTCYIRSTSNITSALSIGFYLVFLFIFNNVGFLILRLNFSYISSCLSAIFMNKRNIKSNPYLVFVNFGSQSVCNIFYMFYSNDLKYKNYSYIKLNIEVVIIEKD